MFLMPFFQSNLIERNRREPRNAGIRTGFEREIAVGTVYKTRVTAFHYKVLRKDIVARTLGWQIAGELRISRRPRRPVVANLGHPLFEKLKMLTAETLRVNRPGAVHEDIVLHRKIAAAGDEYRAQPGTGVAEYIAEHFGPVAAGIIKIQRTG